MEPEPPLATFTLSGTPRTVEDIYMDYFARRNALIRALTHEVDTLYALSDPGNDNLCLFGYPDESWKMIAPSDTVPPKLPEPTVGINFGRDSMSRMDWLSLVAVHSDSWLMAVAYFCGAIARLNAFDRKRLFGLINNMPDVYEVLREWRAARTTPRKEDKPGEASGSKSKNPIDVEGLNDGGSKSTQQIAEEGQEANEKRSKRLTLCGRCGGRYSGDEFWIVCDVCELWYHGMCVGVTPTMAEHIRDYECSFCRAKRGEP